MQFNPIGIAIWSGVGALLGGFNGAVTGLALGFTANIVFQDVVKDLLARTPAVPVDPRDSATPGGVGN